MKADALFTTLAAQGHVQCRFVVLQHVCQRNRSFGANLIACRRHDQRCYDKFVLRAVQCDLRQRRVILESNGQRLRAFVANLVVCATARRISTFEWHRFEVDSARIRDK